MELRVLATPSRPARSPSAGEQCLSPRGECLEIQRHAAWNSTKRGLHEAVRSEADQSQSQGREQRLASIRVANDDQGVAHAAGPRRIGGPRSPYEEYAHENYDDTVG